MNPARMRAQDLDEFVAAVDEAGGIRTPAARSLVDGWDFALTHRVDESLDPFSDAYVDEQVAVYREISGRALDQSVNEWSPVDVAAAVAGANPYNSDDHTAMAEHARTVMAALTLAAPPRGARVLDMGCGWGVSTEMFGFAGCAVDAVDINPDFVSVVEQRASVRGIDVRTHVATFDDFEPDDTYDVVFFYECLHHAIRPWRVLDRLSAAVRPGGAIVVAGEPIQALWWRNWGMRLDPESVYCMRKHGWFESGWSEPMLRECFTRAGFELTLHPGAGIGDSAIGVARRVGDHPAGSPAPPATLARRLARRLPPRVRAVARAAIGPLP